MNVDQLMTRNVRACHPADSLSEAARIMWDRDCGCVPVVEPENGTARLVGMITDRDVCMAAYTQSRLLSEIEVRSAMATTVRSCRSTDSVASALKTMEDNQLHRLPVVEQNGHLVGLLSLADAAREAAREHARATKEMTDGRIGEVLEAISAPRGPREIAATL
jgi:CBS domain-containing protein